MPLLFTEVLLEPPLAEPSGQQNRDLDRVLDAFDVDFSLELSAQQWSALEAVESLWSGRGAARQEVWGGYGWRRCSGGGAALEGHTHFY